MSGPYLILLAANLVFATGYAVSRIVLADVGPATLGLARVRTGGVLPLAWAAGPRGPSPLAESTAGEGEEPG